MTKMPIVSRQQWLEQRLALLEKEKELTRLRDELSEQRRALPWVEVTKNYQFIDVDRAKSLLDLFGERGQLLVYHFMYGPHWETGCKSCSFWADNYNGVDVHLANRDITLLAVSNAPIATLQAFKERMGWSFQWVSTSTSEFSQDYGVTFGEQEKDAQSIYYNYAQQPWYTDEMPGVSVFIRDEADTIYHSYSTFSRGLDILNAAYNLMDLTPKGRDEDGKGMAWLRRRDEYP